MPLKTMKISHWWSLGFGIDPLWYHWWMA